MRTPPAELPPPIARAIATVVRRHGLGAVLAVLAKLAADAGYVACHADLDYAAASAAAEDSWRAADATDRAA